MKNIFIYVSDALRYDHIPESIAEEGNVIPTLAPAGYTPISFSSLATGLDPRNHNVRSFYDTLEKKTVFDLFSDHSYYDHPEDATCQNIFSNYNTAKELDELEEPFVYIERALDTHSPYGQIPHGNEIPDEPDMEGSIQERYGKGVKSTEKHFQKHIEELKEKGLYEDTLVIFTSDHGEFLDEKAVLRRRRGHNKPLRKELCVVPTVFLNYENEWSHMRTIDIVPTALSILDKEPIGDGIDLRKQEPEEGYTMLQVNTEPLIVTGCKWRYDGEWNSTVSRIKPDLATVAIDLFDPLRVKLRNSSIVKRIRNRNNDNQREFHKNAGENLDDLEF